MYSPKIDEILVRKLYQYKMKHSLNVPLTRLVNEAVENYLLQKDITKDGVDLSSSPVFKKH